MASRKTSNQQRKRPECHTPDLTITPDNGAAASQAQRIKQLERDNKELQRANEILRKAAAFFARAELDRK